MRQSETPDAVYLRLGPLGTIVTGLALAGGGLLLTLVFGRSAMQHGAASESWPTTSGVVTASEIAATGTRDERRYHPEVRYEYAVAGRTFTSERIRFQAEGDTQSHARQDIEEIVQQYPQGSSVTVYYNPEDPAASCLETGVNLGAAFVLGLAGIGIGLLIILSGAISMFRRG